MPFTALLRKVTAELHASEDADTILRTAAAQELENRIDVALRFAQTRMVAEFNKEDALDVLIQRISDIRAEERVTAKGAGKGAPGVMEEDL